MSSASRRPASLGILIAVLISVASPPSFSVALPHSPADPFPSLLDRQARAQVKAEATKVTVQVPRFLDGLDLDTAQRERILPILIELAPMLRALENEIRASQATLDDLIAAPRFDDDAARQASAALASSVAALALLRARGEHLILAELTEAQRREVERRRQGGASAGLQADETGGTTTSESAGRSKP